MAPPITVKVELFYSGVWNDISSSTRANDHIQITRGRQDQGNSSDAATCTLKINNRNGQFTPGNAAGALYGLIGRNTPLRITATPVGGSASVRGVFEVPAWPMTWDQSGTDVYVMITAAGIRRRLGQGQTTASVVALNEYVTSTAYARSWPCLTAAELRTGLTWQMTSINAPGTVKFGTYDLGIGQDGVTIPTTNAVRGPNGFLGYGYLDGGVNQGVSSELAVGFVFESASLGPLSFVVNPLVSVNYGTQWEVQLRADGVNNDVIVVQRVNDPSTGITVTTYTGSGALTALTDGNEHVCDFTLTVSGANILYEVDIDGASVFSGTAVTSTVGTIGELAIAYEPGATNAPVGLAWVTVWIDGGVPTLTNFASAGLGYAGETAGNRISRLCSQNSIAFASSGTLANCIAMGGQDSKNLLTLLDEAASADGGVLSETRTAIGFTYRTRQDLYNQATAVTLDYSTKVFGAPLVPTPDDYGVHNDVTATNSGTGGTAEAVLTSGTLSTQAPPNGINAYTTGVSLNLQTDGPLADLAAWLMHLGTIEEPRWPGIVVDMLNPRISGNSTLGNQIAALDIGQKFVLSNLPTWVSGGATDPVNLLLLGYTEDLWQFGWQLTLNSASETPYEVAVYATSNAAQDGAQFDAENSTVHAGGFTAGALSASIDSAAGTIPWTTDAAAMPFYINIAGEKIRVTAITGAASPQTFTIVRAINGISKAHVAGEAVHLWTRSRYAL